ncbi:plasmid partitioning protein RepB C-terminal domain-containing protein [Aliiroseovarius subalbicans]|uniref:plasmid partitioning protein RepB C-terminal domain-containing protein n=1 Tax=Aliiroseovarius subalbicans TaxID=2925840 RepID=UPI001F58DCAB|nr:plasmid partitioning protein RepB C-terminal domain-containing protein [Aliiroseovarius subalbicans]MCI2400827.1 ParB N-terminal domain-containing protein [Aliiroseovarius subalbicans]
MARSKRNKTIGMAFEKGLMRLPLEQICPLYAVRKETKETVKYRQVAASIEEVGLVEPLVVVRDKSDPEKFMLLDGHVRLAILLDLGKSNAPCQVSTDDEAFTYNKRISRLATIQEHKMILKALERGVPEDRLARALNVNIKSLQGKKRLLDGICPEAAELLKDKQIALTGFQILKKMKPMRQIEAAELMVAMNKNTVNYARSLLAATPASELKNPEKPKAVRGISRQQLELMERESANLERELRLVEDTYGSDHLDLVLGRGYVSKLISNARITRYIEMYHPEFLPEFEKITETEALAS